MIRLYRAEFSTNVERVALALAHKGLEVESVWITYDDRGRVRSVSGQDLVPVIVDDGIVVTDSTRILEHLDARHGQAPLYPADAARRTETILLIDWFNRVWKVWPNAIEAELERPQPDSGVIAEHAAEMTRALDAFEALLTGRDFLMGDSLGAADCVVFPFVKYAARREAGDDEAFHRVLDDFQEVIERHRLAAWLRRMHALPRA